MNNRSNKNYRPRKPQGPFKQSRNQKFRKPPLRIQPTTLWDYPSQHYGDGMQGDANYVGATPSYIIWNLLQRYTEEGDLVVDPCCGSGTTLDVARDCGRKALGYDVNPTRDDIFNCDARDLPLENEKVDFVFIDPPYSTHIDYSDDFRCIGKLEAADGSYYEAMEIVISEIDRVLKPGGYMALYVSDSYVHKGQNKGFYPIGFELFGMMQKCFEPVDIVSVIRHNKTLEMGNYRMAAEEGNFYLRGFNYLFVMRKPGKGEDKRKGGVVVKDKQIKLKNKGGDDRRGGKRFEGRGGFNKGGRGNFKGGGRGGFSGNRGQSGGKSAKRQRQRGDGPEFHGQGEKVFGGKKRTFRMEGTPPGDMPFKKKRWNKKKGKKRGDSENGGE